MMKRCRFLLVLLPILFFISCQNAECDTFPLETERPEVVQIYFIYEEVCATCDGTAEFFVIIGRELSGVRNMYPYQIRTINVFEAGGMLRFDNLVQDVLGMEDAAGLRLPMLIIGDQIYHGIGTIEENMREAFLLAGSELALE